MTAKILDGKAMAQEIRGELAQETAGFIKKSGVTPCLTAVLVGDDPASQIYVRNKQKACEKVGITSRLHRLPASTTTEELLELVEQLNADRSVHGILVQLPLPNGVDEQKVLLAVSPKKDVDAFHPENVGLIVQNQPRYLPCTPPWNPAIARPQGDRNGRRECGCFGPKQYCRKTDGNNAYAKRRGCRFDSDRLP